MVWSGYVRVAPGRPKTCPHKCRYQAHRVVLVVFVEGSQCGRDQIEHTRSPTQNVLCKRTTEEATHQHPQV